VDRLREIGVITGFTVQVDHAKLGWGVEAFTELRYAGRTGVGEIVATASTVPEVQAIYTIAGDLPHLQTVIDTLRRAGTVTGTKTLMVLGSWTRES
jgi:Lrp/AsnC family leucine-responsive transcriptional regulator